MQLSETLRQPATTSSIRAIIRACWWVTSETMISSKPRSLQSRHADRSTLRAKPGSHERWHEKSRPKRRSHRPSTTLYRLCHCLVNERQLYYLPNLTYIALPNICGFSRLLELPLAATHRPTYIVAMHYCSPDVSQVVQVITMAIQ